MKMTQKTRDSLEWYRLQSEAMRFIDTEFGPDKRYLAALVWHATSGLGHFMSARSPQERAEVIMYGPPMRMCAPAPMLN